MGSIDHPATDIFATGGDKGCDTGPFCLNDYNDLTHGFLHELRLRTHGENLPRCLFIDIEEGGEALRMVSRRGNDSRRMLRSDCRCFDGCNLAGGAGHAGESCRIVDWRPEAAALATDARYDLLMSCHSISFIPNARARCFLKHLRHNVRAGGMLFISALGRYSRLADGYPAENELLANRFSALKDNAACHLAPDTKLCLYSERELCNTLFESGWSVLRSATTTENNVLATAIRV